MDNEEASEASEDSETSVESNLKISDPELHKYILKEYHTIRMCKDIMEYVNEILDNGDMYKNLEGLRIH